VRLASPPSAGLRLGRTRVPRRAFRTAGDLCAEIDEFVRAVAVRLDG
jgi:hypothetical protein